MKTKVKWFKNEKGYGFIEYKDNGDILVHYSTTKEGEYTKIELIKTDNGYKMQKDQLTGLFNCV